MEDGDMDWIQEPKRDQIANQNYSEENLSDFERPLRSTKDPGATVLDMVSRTVELIGEVENCAAEKLACAETLANQAIEKLKYAQDRVRSAETAQ